MFLALLLDFRLDDWWTVMSSKEGRWEGNRFGKVFGLRLIFWDVYKGSRRRHTVAVAYHESKA